MLVIAVIAVAYGSAAPTLGVAEFSPAARQALDAPPTTADSPAAARGAGRRSTTTSTTARPTTTAGSASSESAPATTRVGRGRPCFGNPPRQLPDPRSPSCSATVFEGDNGGATSTGVTATEIRVAWPSRAGGEVAHRVGVASLFEYINRHFEFYGRRLVPVYAEFGAINDVPAQRAFAAQIAQQGVFAALEREPDQRWFPSFFSELARERIVTIALNAHTMLSDREMFDALHPYLWSVYPSMEQSWANIGDFACTALANRPALHAGPSLAGKTRVFGIYAVGQQRVPSVRALTDRLGACGANYLVGEYLTSRDSGTQVATVMQRFKDAGVTTLICACADNTNTGGPANARSNGMVDAEWVMPIFTRAELDETYTQGIAPEQRTRMFGLQPHPKVMAAQTQWWYASALEINDVIAAAPATYYWGQTLYDELLVLAAGIQAAGPALTPETFAAGLMTTPFPNTGAGAAPYWQPSVGFGLGDHGFYNDYALAWWNDAAEYQGLNRAPGTVQGSWCYLGRGSRYNVGHYPADADSRFFAEQPCR